MNALPVETDRATVISIDGRDYALVLSTRATREIAKKYGGLNNLGEKLLGNQDFEKGLEEIVWLITLLANQGIQRHNLRNRNDQKALLTEDEVDVLTDPKELSDYRSALLGAMTLGAKRNITSEDETEKNAVDG